MSTPKSWEPAWPTLPPVAPLDRTVPLPVVELTEEEREQRRRDYRTNHERHARGRG